MWRLAPLTELRWRRWGDEWVVYDIASGDTHQMDTLTAVTLGSLETQPYDLSELAEQVSMELEISDIAKVEMVLAEILERLGKLGLIEPLTP